MAVSNVFVSEPESPNIIRNGWNPVRWDAFVRTQVDASYTHLAGWRTVMRDALGHETLYLVAADEHYGEWLGVLPLVWVRSRIFGRYLVSMPFLNSGGPIGSPSARAALTGAAAVEAQRRGATLLELRNRTASDGLALSHRKITVRLPLPESPSELWDSFSSKLRSQIRRSTKAGLTTRFGLGEREGFYDVYARHMRDLGSPALGPNVFEMISRVFPSEVEYAVVYQGDRPVAAGCGFHWRDEFELVWASSLREFNAVAPNMQLYWSLMERAIAQRRTVFDFGRCSVGSGTHRFKQQWGGRDVPLPWGQWSSRGAVAPPTPDQKHFRAAVEVWRHLPPFVTRACGPALARLIP